jgi:hypothetical protein
LAHVYWLAYSAFRVSDRLLGLVSVFIALATSETQKQIPTGMTERKAKAKGCAVNAALSDLYISIVTN